MRLKTLLLALSLLSFGVSTSALADFNDGVDAYLSEDYKTAFSEWKPLAEQGNAKAQYNLGTIYEYGFDVLRDPQEAIKWYQKASNQGNGQSAINLAEMYARGFDAPKDVTKESNLLKKFYEGSDMTSLDKAEYWLKLANLWGRGFDAPRESYEGKDMAKAKYWIKNAYEGGDAEIRKLAIGIWDKFELWKY
jgi:TPR repeat protein